MIQTLRNTTPLPLKKSISPEQGKKTNKKMNIAGPNLTNSECSLGYFLLRASFNPQFPTPISFYPTNLQPPPPTPLLPFRQRIELVPLSNLILNLCDIRRQISNVLLGLRLLLLRKERMRNGALLFTGPTSISARTGGGGIK